MSDKEEQGSRRVAELVEEEPGRTDAYRQIIELCRTSQTYSAIEQAMEGVSIPSHNALSGLPVYPSALVAHLEDAGALAWDGDGWSATDEALAYLDAADDAR